MEAIEELFLGSRKLSAASPDFLNPPKLRLRWRIHLRRRRPRSNLPETELDWGYARFLSQWAASAAEAVR